LALGPPYSFGVEREGAMPDGFAGRYEVLEDRGAGRRTWPTDMKLRIVGESHAPGVMVSEVARRHRLMPSQVTTW